ncbi:MAG: hypothetical protein Q9184_005413 [Pyrenodesmia sp. 2 TL-2023]
MPPYNLTARDLYAGGREIPTSSRNEQHNLNHRDLHPPRMAAPRSFNLPTSTRSGHPIFPTGNRASSNYQPPTYDTESSSPFGINISPLGTWKPAKDGHPTANIEILDLTKRFGYDPDDKMRPKRQAKNALRRGFKPTMPSELPPQKRTIHEISSGEEEEEEEEVTVSDASPLRAKRRRMRSATNAVKPHLSALDELRAAAAAKSASPVMSHTQLTLPEASRAQAANHPDTNPSDSSSSSHTVIGTHETDQPMICDPHSPFRPPLRSRHVNQASSTTNTAAPTTHEAITITATQAPVAPYTTNHATISISDHLPASTHTLLTPALTSSTITLRIYLPSATRVYVPLKLHSTPTLPALFLAVEKIIDHPASLLTMHFYPNHFPLDGPSAARTGVERAGTDVDIMAVKKGVDGSWECFLEEVGKRGRGDVWVGVEVVGMGEA